MEDNVVLVGMRMSTDEVKLRCVTLNGKEQKTYYPKENIFQRFTPIKYENINILYIEYTLRCINFFPQISLFKKKKTVNNDDSILNIL